MTVRGHLTTPHISRKMLVLLVAATIAGGIAVAAGIMTWHDTPAARLSQVRQAKGVENLLVTWGSLDELVDASPVIVRGTLISEHEEIVEIPTPGEPSVLATRTDVVREFRVDKVISGDWTEDSIEVREAGYLWAPPPEEGFPPQEITNPVPSASPGKDYMLFLTTATDYNGAMVFNPQANPSMATVARETLTFVVTDDYVKDAQAAGLLEPGERVPPGFVGRTLQDLQASAAGRAERLAAKAAYDAAHPAPTTAD